MPSNIYYFEPCAVGAKLIELVPAYRLIPLVRNLEEPPDWEFPAVLVGDEGKGDLRRLQEWKLKSDAWRVICLIGDGAPPPAKLKSRIFSVLSRNVPQLTLATAVEKAFEDLHAQEEQRHTRLELRRAASDVETLNKIGSRPVHRAQHRRVAWNSF